MIFEGLGLERFTGASLSVNNKDRLFHGLEIKPGWYVGETSDGIPIATNAKLHHSLVQFRYFEEGKWGRKFVPYDCLPQILKDAIPDERVYISMSEEDL